MVAPNSTPLHVIPPRCPKCSCAQVLACLLTSIMQGQLLPPDLPPSSTAAHTHAAHTKTDNMQTVYTNLTPVPAPAALTASPAAAIACIQPRLKQHGVHPTAKHQRAAVAAERQPPVMQLAQCTGLELNFMQQLQHIPSRPSRTLSISQFCQASCTEVTHSARFTVPVA